MRKYDILSITPGTPSVIELNSSHGNVTQSFHGKEWIDGAGVRSPFYTYSPPTINPPAGTGVLIATTFELVGNPSYTGRYTVYTKSSLIDFNSSEFSAGTTKIRINEVMGVPISPGDTGPVGYITNISTYVLEIEGESSLLLLEQQNYDVRPVELMGRNSSGWGEVYAQNFLRQVQSFAGATAPAAPFIGQLWYDTASSFLRIWNGATWPVVNSATVVAPHRHTQAVASTTWTVVHNLGVSMPFIAEASFFIDIGGGVYKPIIPADITYTSPNQLTVTFSNPEAGYAIVRPS